MGIRVVLADDHAILREGVRLVLAKAGIDVLGEAADGVQLVRLARELQPQVVVADLSMPRMNGLDAVAEILRDLGIPCVMLTMHCDPEYVSRAMAAGVSGYVLKSRAGACLVEAIREVHAGNIYLGAGISNEVFQKVLGRIPPEERLTSRERQVLQLIAEGHTTKEVASLMGITVRTGESHRARIMDKLNIRNTAGLVRYALKRGLSEL